MVRFITTWRRRSNRNLRIVDKALGNASVSHVVASGEFPNDWAVLRLADYTVKWLRKRCPVSQD